MNTKMATINSQNTENFHNEKQTVLIVDDSKVIRLALNKILKNDFIVIQANDGEDAWEKLQAHAEIIAVFSDVSMPNLDGFGLLDRVRTAREAHISELPFVIITANDDDPDFATKVSNAGGNDLITKPFKTDEIKACIQNHIHAESTPVTVPSEEIAAIPTEEVAEILGFEDIETGQTEHLESKQAPTPAMDFGFDDDFFETTTNDSVLESAQGLNIDNQASSTAAESYETLADVDLDMDLDLEFANTSAAEDEFVFTIDEDFLNTSLESNANEQSSGTSERTNDKHPELSLAEEAMQQVTPVAMELSLEEHTTTESRQEHSAIEEIAIKLESARQHATEVAQSNAAHAHEESPENKARLTTEREQIRARLQQIREQEKEDIANIRAARLSRGNSASLFSKLGRIISALFGARKK